jgi:hypothetical protein
VAVMGPEGRIIRDLTVDIPRPRQVGVGGFDQVRRELLAELGVEEVPTPESGATPTEV